MYVLNDRSEMHEQAFLFDTLQDNRYNFIYGFTSYCIIEGGWHAAYTFCGCVGTERLCALYSSEIKIVLTFA